MTICRGLLQRAALTPDAIALEAGGRAWSFGELAQFSRRGAHFVQQAVAGDDGPVALLLDSGAEFAAWFHAVRLTGRPVLPLNLRLTSGELAQQLEDARCACVLATPGDSRLAEFAGRLPGLRALPAPALDSLPDAASSSLPAVLDDDGTAAVLYTSGTSGRAKGACLSWNNFVASALAAGDLFGLAVRSRWLACMPLFHVGGISMLVRSVVFGGPVLQHSRFDAAAVSDALDRGGIAGISLVPTMLSRLLAQRAGRRSPPGLEVLLLGGAAAAPELVSRALAAGYPVCPTYGLTEAASQVATAAPPVPGAGVPQPMRPTGSTRVRIVTDGRDAAPGEAGEILVQGPTVMKGYLHDTEATGRALRGGWLHTGDAGLVGPDGGLVVLDRRDDLVVSGGENVYPAQIEAVLLEHPAVADAGVTGLPDADLGARVTAWIVVAPGCQLAAEDLRRHCRDRLAGYKQPREFRFVAALPRTASGKLQRRRLAG